MSDSATPFPMTGAHLARPKETTFGKCARLSAEISRFVRVFVGPRATPATALLLRASELEALDASGAVMGHNMREHEGLRIAEREIASFPSTENKAQEKFFSQGKMLFTSPPSPPQGE